MDKDLLYALGILAGGILILRSFGSWMFRTDEIIKNQKEILAELKKINDNKNP